MIIDIIKPKKFFQKLCRLVIFKDVIERFGAKNIYALKFLVERIISSFSCKFSINKIFNELKSIDVKSRKGVLYDYASYLDYVFFPFKEILLFRKKSALSIPKVYLSHLGPTNYLLCTKFSEDIGKKMENAVFID